MTPEERSVWWRVYYQVNRLRLLEADCAWYHERGGRFKKAAYYQKIKNEPERRARRLRRQSEYHRENADVIRLGRKLRVPIARARVMLAEAASRRSRLTEQRRLMGPIHGVLS